VSCDEGDIWCEQRSSNRRMEKIHNKELQNLYSLLLFVGRLYEE